MSEFDGGVAFGAVKPNENKVYSSPIEDAGVTFGGAVREAPLTGINESENYKQNDELVGVQGSGFAALHGIEIPPAGKYSEEEEDPYPDGSYPITAEDYEQWRQEQENGGSEFESFIDWFNSNPNQGFKNLGQPDSTPISNEEIAQIEYLEAKREEYGYSTEEWYGEEGLAYDQTLWKLKEYAVDTEYAQELIKKVKDEHALNKEQIAKALENAVKAQGADWGAWGETVLDVIGKAAESMGDLATVPGVTITHNPNKGVYATILIPIPGLPDWIQGDGLEISVTKNGRFVLGDSIRKQVNKISEKIKELPESISKGIENAVKEIGEAGQKVKRIWTDGKGNILADIIDTAGELLEVLTLPVSIFAGGNDDANIIDFLLKSGLLKDALEWLKKKFKEGGDDTDPDDDIIVDPDDPDDPSKRPITGEVTFGDPSKRPITGEVTFGDPSKRIITGGATLGESTKGKDPITGGATLGETTKGKDPITGGATLGEITKGDDSSTGGATLGEITKSNNVVIEGGGSTASDIVTGGTNVSDTFTSGGGGGGNPFMGVPLRRQRPPVEEEEDPFDPFYFGDFENIYDPVAIVMNPEARKQFGAVGIRSLAVRDLVISEENLDRIQEQAKNIGTTQNKKPANVEDMRAASAARGGLVQPSFPDKLQRIMRYAI